jgi:GxxExxY protein
MKEELNRLTEAIIGAAIAVHRELGPGLLESAYQAAMEYELRDRGLRIDPQKEMWVVYRGVRLDCAYRLDVLVEDKVIVELKAVEKLEPIHDAQLLSYLRLAGCSVGLLINFHVTLLQKGIRRLVHNFPG